MQTVHSIAVFCGSRVGGNPAYAQAARDLGTGLAEVGIRLVYGGGRIGLMGVLADAVLAGGGQVLGIIPDFLRQREVAHLGLTEMRVTTSMHERKRAMAEAADAFVALPGGLGTFDETIEILTWRLLGLHDKPILLCDVAGSAAPLRALIAHAIAEQFADAAAAAACEVVPGVAAVLARLRSLPAGPPVAPGRL